MKKKEYQAPTVRFFKLNSGALLAGSDTMNMTDGVGSGIQLGRDYDFSLDEDEDM